MDGIPDNPLCNDTIRFSVWYPKAFPVQMGYLLLFQPDPWVFMYEKMCPLIFKAELSHPKQEASLLIFFYCGPYFFIRTVGCYLE